MRVRAELWQDGELRCEVVPLNSMVGNLVGFAQTELSMALFLLIK